MPMKWRHVCRDLLIWSIGALLLAAAVVMTCPMPEVGLEDAVRAASRKLMAIDSNFRPTDHAVRIYRQCCRALPTIDYSRRGEGPVVARATVTSWGFVRYARFYRPEEGVEGMRTGHLFRLRPDGSLGEEIPPSEPGQPGIP